MLDLSLGAPDFYFSQEVVLKSRVNWRTVSSDVAQMPWGAIVFSPVMVDDLDAEIGRIIEVRVPSIKVRWRSGDEPWFDELYRATFSAKAGSLPSLEDFENSYQLDSIKRIPA